MIGAKLASLYSEHKAKHGYPPDSFEITEDEFDELYKTYVFILDREAIYNRRPKDGYIGTFMGVPLVIVRATE